MNQSDLCRYSKSTMDEVTIILQNANAPFAVWSDSEQDIKIAQESETTNETAKYEYRIQVSAKHLMLASPVFKKTLSGGWKEFHLCHQRVGGDQSRQLGHWGLYCFYEDYSLSTQCHTAQTEPGIALQGRCFGRLLRMP